MSPNYGIAAFFVGLVVFVALRVPHDKRSKETKVTENRKGLLEIFVLFLAALGCFVLPLIYITTNVFAFADYSFSLVSLLSGLIIQALGLWLFYRSHADLGRNWSYTLEVRENHQVVDWGVYRFIRHPMYASFLVYGIAQALLLPNWIAGFSFLVAYIFMFVLRIGPEERMLLEKLGEPYQAYRLKTKRLIPGVW